MANENPVVNLVPTRAFASPPIDRAQPVMPPAPPFLDNGGAVAPLARDPMAPPTMFDAVKPMTILAADRATGASVQAAPASQASVAVRPLR